MRTNAEIIKFIKKQMKIYDISGNELAALTKNAKSTVSRYLNETNEFPINKADSFAKALHTTPEEIIGVYPKPLNEHQYTPSHTYPYIPASISAGALETVDAVEDEQTITIPDSVVGKYAGDTDVRFMHVNGESMNHVIPNGSLIGVKAVDNASDLQNGNIVVFSDDKVDYSVKRFYNNEQAKVYSFTPDSSDSEYQPIVYRYEDADSINIIGRVVVYVVTL